MKTSVSEVIEEKEIDWSKAQLVIADDGLICLTSGESGETTFEGTVMRDTDYDVGHISDDWTKKLFKIFTGKLTLEN